MTQNQNVCSNDPDDSSRARESKSEKNPVILLGIIAKNSSTAAQRQIMRYYLQSQSARLLPHERVNQCHRALAPLREHVEVYSQPDMKRAYYHNLVVCARLWQCPVCASRISEVRRADIQKGMDNINNRSALITYTLSHHKHDDLQTVLDALLNAFGKMKTGDWWVNFKKRYGWIGSIRALEVTYGKNGWHPHCHEIAFVDEELDLIDFDEMREELITRWTDMIQRQGRFASAAHGCTLEPTYTSVAEYVSKWGRDPAEDKWSAAREVAKASSKQAGESGLTPFQMLKNYGAGDEEAGLLFQEYSTVFKGKNQLHWSHNLRKIMMLTEPELGVDEAAAQIPPGAKLLAELTQEQWLVVLKKKQRGQLLEIAAKGDEQELLTWLGSLGIVPTVRMNADDYLTEQLNNRPPMRKLDL